MSCKSVMNVSNKYFFVGHTLPPLIFSSMCNSQLDAGRSPFSVKMNYYIQLNWTNSPRSITPASESFLSLYTNLYLFVSVSSFYTSTCILLQFSNIYIVYFLQSFVHLLTYHYFNHTCQYSIQSNSSSHTLLNHTKSIILFFYVESYYILTGFKIK